MYVYTSIYRYMDIDVYLYVKIAVAALETHAFLKDPGRFQAPGLPQAGGRTARRPLSPARLVDQPLPGAHSCFCEVLWSSPGLFRRAIDTKKP